MKTILDAVANSLVEGGTHRDQRVRKLLLELSTSARWAQSKVWRETSGAGEVCAALQGRQATARAHRPEEYIATTSWTLHRVLPYVTGAAKPSTHFPPPLFLPVKTVLQWPQAYLIPERRPGAFFPSL